MVHTHVTISWMLFMTWLPQILRLIMHTCLGGGFGHRMDIQPRLALTDLFWSLAEALVQLPYHFWLQQTAARLLHIGCRLRIMSHQISSEHLHSDLQVQPS